MPPLDFNLLIALDALLQETSVSRAAKRVGLSTPAMSHALARLRERLKDPVLVRSGRSMQATPRAIAMKDEVHALVASVRRTLDPAPPFDPAVLDREFVVHASDYVLTMLGDAVDRNLRADAPRVRLRFVPNSAEDVADLRDGRADLAVGIYGELPSELRTRSLLTDRFVCVVRRGHPVIRGGLTVEAFAGLEHVQVAPRGKPGGYIDDVLRARGLERRVARAVPYFVPALKLVSNTDYVLTISERLARSLAASAKLVVLEPPLRLRAYALSLLWAPRLDTDPGHRLIREAFVRAAKEVAGDRHADARTKLDPTDPTSGSSRRRPRRLKL